MLQTVNLTKQYGDNYALKNLNLTIAPGEIFCLLGQNGAGKTTTINLFLGLISPTAGKVFIDNVEVNAESISTREKIAYIPEVVQLYGNMNGIENIQFFSQLAGYNFTLLQLKELLLKAGLKEEDHTKKLAAYSKGMRQKVGIAIALSKNADYIFMDEPISGLDPKAAMEFTKICKELSREGKTIFMATHDIFNAVNIGNKIGIMNEGELVHSTTTDSISANQLQEIYLKTI